MSSPSQILSRQRLAALFLVALLLWFSPLVQRFEQFGRWLGIPVLYLYLFLVWAAIIAAAALIIGRDRD